MKHEQVREATEGKCKAGEADMQKQPLISIITPTYNHQRFIGQCIESVLAQSYDNWEQIIIDDGSTDKTREVVAQYKDERIKYIRQDNVGIWKLSETYNKALQISQGELIAVLEGDDFWPSDKLEKQIHAFDRQEVVLSWGKAAVTSSDGETIYIIPNKNLKWFKNRTRKEILRKLLLQNFIPACTAMCRKDALVSIGGFKQPEGIPLVDYPTWLELGLVGEIRPVDEVLGFWRQHEQQVSSTRRMEMVETSKYCIDFFRSMPPELKSSVAISIDDLLKKYQHDIASSNFALGRINLNQGKWSEARKNLRQALDKGTLSTKIKALLGIVCSYLKLDLEWAALLMRRPRLSKFL